MKKLLLLIVMLFSANAALAGGYEVPYASLLKAHLHNGNKQGIKTVLVNYKTWNDDKNHALAMQQLLQTEPGKLTGNERKAFWINAYNLLTVDLILQKKERESIKNAGSLLSSPWQSNYWTIAGKRYNLDQIENKILRPLGDPRIHMAINCASLSCPDLLAEPYSAATLDKQLDQQVKLFLSNPSKGVKSSKGDLQISKIFDWFSDDFKTAGGVLAFINKYQPASAIDGYFDYNWQLNGNW